MLLGSKSSNIDELSLHRPLVTSVASMKRPKRKNTMGVCTTIDRGSQNFFKSNKNKTLTDFFLSKSDKDVLYFKLSIKVQLLKS